MNMMKKILTAMVIITLLVSSVAFAYDVQYEFKDGIAVVKNDGKFGYVTEDGTELVPCEYDYAFDFADGMANVVKNNKCGYINAAGVLVIPCEYEGATDFSEGAAAVQKDGKWAYVNKEGVILTPFIYDEAGFFNEGFARVMFEGSYGYINLHGQEVVPCMYDEENAYIALYNAPKNQPAYTGVVIPIASKVTVDGVEKSLDAYEIQDYNYVKLRSLADALADSNAPVSIDWDPVAECILLADIVTEEVIEEVTEEATEEVIEEATEEVTEEVTEETAEEIIDETVEEVMEEVAPETVEEAIEEIIGEADGPTAILVAEPAPETAEEVVLEEAPVAPVVITSTCDVIYNGKPVTLNGYEIDGNNYFKLRDMTDLFGIGINWNEAMQVVEIITSK